MTVLIAVALVGGSISAAVINVPDEAVGIQAGIEVAEIGDTVLVAPGDYSENIILNKGVYVISSGGPDVTTLVPADSTEPILVTFGMHDGLAEFSGFDISGGYGNHVVHLHDADTVVFAGNVVHDNPGGGAVIYADYCNAIIRGNVLHHNVDRTAIYNWGLAITIDHNTIAYNGAGASMFSYCPFHSNIVAENTGTGLSLTGGWWSFYFEYNLFWNNGIDHPDIDAFGDFNLYVDPLFAHPEGGDFSLPVGSPAIDAGDPRLEYCDVDGSIGDIGAKPRIGSGQPFAGYLYLDGDDFEYVASENPEFNWSIVDSSSASQAAFEIEIGSDPDWTTVEMWDSGPVWSASEQISYAGLPLAEGATYHGRVRVNNGSQWGSWNEFTFRTNVPPPAPTPLSPEAGETLLADFVELWCQGHRDADSSFVMFFEFGVFAQEDTGSIVSTATRRVTFYPGHDRRYRSGFMPGLVVDSQYYWRVRASDSYEYSPWTEARRFYTRANTTLNVPAEYPTIDSAVTASFSGDTVLVAPGVYGEATQITLKSLVLMSSEGPSETVWNPSLQGPSGANNPALFLWLNGGDTVQVSGFQFVGNYSPGGLITSSTYAGSGSLMLDNCTFHGMQDVHQSMVISGGHADVVADHCLFYDNPGWGIYSIGEGMVTNCTFVDCLGGIHGLAGTSMIQNNIFVGVESATDYVPTSTLVDYNLYWECGSIDNPGPNDTSADPRFVNPAGHDYHLRYDSPCIDAGNPDPEYDDPNGSRCDLGAFPFVAPVTYAVPDTLYAWQAGAVDPDTLVVYLGELPDPYDMTDVQASTLTLNGISPNIAEVMSDHNGYSAGAVRMEFLVPEVLGSFPPVWGIDSADYTIAGAYLDGSTFEFEGHMILAGHVPGDVNADYSVDISDIVYLVEFSFNGGPPPPVPSAIDLTCDGSTDISDLVYLVSYMFQSGPAPEPCP